MRWVNHYTHPGDTRYHVFVFREAHCVSRFESRCQEEGIPYEKHEEGEEVIMMMMMMMVVAVVVAVMMMMIIGGW